ncbi:NAD(P)/FAD-dependent oxidoreductase [bacterium]
MNASHSDILIIGGGASGMMAALTAAQQNLNVRILEQMTRVGKKLLVTGNSRCNLTNLSANPVHYHGANDKFIAKVFQQCDVQKTLTVFQNLGLAWKADHENRVYPVSEQASSVLDLLRFALSHHHVDICSSSKVDIVEYQNHQFTVTLKNHQQFSANRVILAAGGQTMKDLGSNGSGFILANKLGHQIIEPFPALVKIVTKSSYSKGLKGVKTDATVTLMSDKQTIQSCSGELLFTEDGLSGIPILKISRHIHDILKQKNNCSVQIDLLPTYSQEDLKTDLSHRFKKLEHLTAEQALLSIIKKRLIIPVLKTAEIAHHIPASNLTETQIDCLIYILKHWDFPVIGTKAWNEAQVTAGGVDTEEIDPATMESHLVPGLYFSGEIMNVDGDCGGYNLQWAWSTGFIAGNSASDSLKSEVVH